MSFNRASIRLGAVLSCCGAAGALVPALPALAEPVQMVLGISGQLPTSSRSAIPGTIPTSATVTAASDPRFTNFGIKMFRSPTSNRWITVATTNNLPNTADQVLIIGSGLSIVGNAVAAREGVTATMSGDILNFGGLQYPRINDSDQWAMAYRPNGGTGPTDRVAKFDGATLFTAFQAGDMVSANGGTTLTGSMVFLTTPTNSASISNSGAVSFLATGTAPTIFGSNGAAALITVFTDAPSGQVNSDASTWTSLSGFSQDAAAAHWLALGKIGSDASKDSVVVVDGVVKVQEGSVLAGSGFASPVTTISDGFMESNGDWYVRGQNVDNTSWLTRNGTVVAVSGASITPGSSEHWKPATNFIDIRGNNAGNYVIIGTTDNSVTTQAAVIVLNGVRVVARASDAVDVGDGVTPANSLFLHTPFQSNGVFNNDSYYYFFSRLKATSAGTAGAGTSPNNASIVRVFACPADYNQSGSISVGDIFDFLNGWFAGNIAADYDRSGALAVADIFAFLNGWFAGC